MARQNKDESGFTLQELLVAVNIGFLMVSFGLLLFLSVNKILFSWQTRTTVKNTVDSLINRIAIDTEISAAIMGYAGTLLVLQHAQGRAITYRFKEGRVSRNEMLINQSDMRVDALFTVSSVKGGNEIVEIEVVGRNGRHEYKRKVHAGTNPDSESGFRADLTHLDQGSGVREQRSEVSALRSPE